MASNFDRRTFLKSSAAWAAAIPAAQAWGATGIVPAGNPQSGPLLAALESGFLHPPDSARPWVYWFASDGNITREGITADLEAMHRAGIRGLIYMEVDQGVPKGPARFLSPQWRELMQHAFKEATRLGITIDMNNDGGWCGSGGPWNTPEMSMQIVVWSETQVEGPIPYSGKLAQPMTVRDYYSDIATLAFPTPTAELVRMADRSPTITYGVERHPLDAAGLLDGNPGTVVRVPLPEKGKPQYLNVEFPEPFTARALTVALVSRESELRGNLEVSDDGRDFRKVREVTFRWPVSSVNFEQVSARYFRIAIEEYEEYWLESKRDFIPMGIFELHSAFRIEDIPGKAAYRTMSVHTSGPSIPLEMAIRRDQIIDISGNMGRDGQLDWDVPRGKWTVLRLGHTTTGKENHPAPQESLGLECDKLSKKAVEAHFEAMIGKLLADQAAVGAKALSMAHIDSWEVGSQNWTAEMRQKFNKKFAYDLLPFLPVLTGRAVESREVSERVLWDLRRLVGDLMLENYAEYMRALCHQRGLKLSIEGYDNGPFDEVAFGGRADMPTGEFWMGEHPDHGLLERPPSTWVKEMASSGHVYGKPIIAAEAFTAFTGNAKWQNYPYQLKPVGDWAFATGVNRFVFHRYSMHAALAGPQARHDHGPMGPQL